ncbi:Sjoegren syndrome/scleroderma autoantigen 1 homolog isoform X2 [Limulus polyphemus]|uniref:Sjoegren syndrome/scleroderma autoantigen 1 homolog isoform X2 n=1 Tax=Limulus polyphemus TaxID=6850 RepID=A0ABM1T8F1_LIMPO|nr:Sjoegren syndrome/scleroderma autoantigen 1 homolog isoform X2 [Limulus polyphemus]
MISVFNKTTPNKMEKSSDSIWEPPTDAEMKVIRAKRERADKISSLMGDYLLKGYKMLNTICEMCETILLKDKQGNLYCVACSEVDAAEHAKDNPALSDTAAKRQKEEVHYVLSSPEQTTRNQPPEVVSSTMSSASLPPPGIQPSFTTSQDAVFVSQDTIFASVSPTTASLTSASKSRSDVGVTACKQDNHLAACLSQSTEALLEKLTWASNELKKSQCVEGSVHLCSLMKTCCETLLSLQNVKNNFTQSS